MPQKSPYEIVLSLDRENKKIRQCIYEPEY